MPGLFSIVIRRIQILGGAGSGKSTLASAYARRYNVPHRELDDIVWANIKQHRLRPGEERDRLLKELIDADEWVLDGIFWQSWIRPAFERAERIVVLNIPEITRHFRVITRHFKLASRDPVHDYRFFFPTLLPLLKLNRTYRGGPYKETLANLSEFEEKVVICNSNREAAELLGL